MSSTGTNCICCSKECKVTDSKPYPNSKSKERIHNRCYIKKSMADRNVKSMKPKTEVQKTQDPPRSNLELPAAALQLMDKFQGEEEMLKTEAKVKKLSDLIATGYQRVEKDRNTSSFFFDMKAGIAKPHEKRKYLNHRKISEMAPRYDDHGFQNETACRSYDHSGKDLNTLSNESGSDTGSESHEQVDQKTAKRKSIDKRINKRSVNSVNLTTDSCWFCLSSPDVEKHLIVTIASHCYMTLAKGGLVEEHLLLVPIEHISSVTAKQNSDELLTEKESLIERIVDYFRSKSKGVVFFERNFRSGHWQIHAVPVPMSFIEGLAEKVKEASMTCYPKGKYMDFSCSLHISDIVRPGDPYLHWRIEPGGSNFATIIDVKESFFPLQLPRMVLAEVLNTPDRVDWRRCCKSREDYVELVARIKQEWKRFDISGE